MREIKLMPAVDNRDKDKGVECVMVVFSDGHNEVTFRTGWHEPDVMNSIITKVNMVNLLALMMLKVYRTTMHINCDALSRILISEGSDAVFNFMEKNR